MSKVKAVKKKEIIPTYVPPKANDLPMFFENKPYQGASGRLYPLPFSDNISDEKTDVAYEVYTLENEYIKTQVVPALGGKILNGKDKKNGYDFIYHNEVVKPALVGLAGPWISGGIEFNWPQHHRPTTYMPLEAVIEENPDGGKTVWTGEVEPFNRMKGMAGITVDPGRSYIKAKVRLYNRTAMPQIFMWWANLAVSVNDQYRVVFPPDVEWVNDHDRRAVLEWPIAKGVYHTARPFDYGKGTDISRYESVLVPSSFLISQGQSDMDFIAGYDMGRDAGIVTVADHQISPGKKLWTWGKGDFGDMWCSNLTDENGPYVELMTGVFTDNQPDFTWIAPFDSRSFEQVWYPVRGIGDVKNATVDAAMNLKKRKDRAFVGIMPTGSFPEATLRLTCNGTVIFEETRSLTPDEPYCVEVSLGGRKFEEIKATLTDREGKVLVSYRPYIRGQKKPIEVRKPVKRPCEIENNEELYLNALHLEQYKQHNYDARDYYAEGLRRDRYDSRCNTGMARISLKNGDFEGCVAYADRAIARLTLRNQHPADTQAFYLKGLALRYLGRDAEAEDAFSRVIWNGEFRCAAYLELANLAVKRGDMEEALEKCDISASLSGGNTRALCLKAAILRHVGRDAEAWELARSCHQKDLLDLFALWELSLHEPVDSQLEQFFKKPENVLDVVCNYLAAGLYEDALTLLEKAAGDYPLSDYYRAYLQNCRPADPTAALQKAAAADTGYCFPSRLEDIAVLRFAIDHNPADDNACYYLGCLYYDRFAYQKAKDLFEECVKRNPEHKKAWRNLSYLYFEKFGKPQKAETCMKKAMQLKGDDPRMLFEYQQLLKNRNVSPQKRLAVYDRYPELLAKRDDCYLDKIILLCTIGQYKTAIDMAARKHFHIYEGGEGKLTKQHAWMHVLYGNDLAAAGKWDQAIKAYEDGVNMPKSYGEAKTFFNQEAHINYFLGKTYEAIGEAEKAEVAFEKATEYKAAVSEISLFRALALRRCHQDEKASAVLKEMKQTAENLLKNKDLRTYYGVGSPSPMPFENDVVKNNTVDGKILLAFALLGMNRKKQAEAQIRDAEAISPYDFRIHAFYCIENRI